MIDCEDVKHVEHCIICYEIFDNMGAVTVCSKDIVIARECACNYIVHRTCWERWKEQRPFPNHDLQCLVCASPVELRRSRCEIMSGFISHTRLCTYIVFVVGFTVFFVMTYSIYN